MMRILNVFNNEGMFLAQHAGQQATGSIFSPLDSAGRKRGGAMKCLLLKGKYMICCTAVKESYIPSMFELDEFCRQKKHKMCPLYRQAETDGKIIIMTDMKKTEGRGSEGTACCAAQTSRQPALVHGLDEKNLK